MAEPRDPEKYPYQTVDQTERDGSPLPAAVHKKRRFWEKLSFYNIGVLIFGTIAVFLAIVFLTFVWVASRRAINHHWVPPLWRAIVRNSWTSRVVTLCTVMIRVATAAQLGVFAAIMAALILERVGASAEDFPLLSMIRCSNTGPQSLMWNVIHTIPSGAQFGYSVIIVIALFNALTLQFTSTILLADFGDAVVVLNKIQRPLTFGFSSSDEGSLTNTYTGIDYWKQGPDTYPSFAEYKEAGLEGNTFVDTGKTYRGFPPFRDSGDRQKLHTYTGPMTIVDARVVCVKPNFSNLTADPNSLPTPSISGNLTFPNTHPSLTESFEDGYRFNCSLPVRDMTTIPLWDLSLCTFGWHVGKLADNIYPDDEPSMPTGHSTASLWLNATVFLESESADGDPVYYPGLDSLEDMETSSAAWGKFGNENATFDASLCFINPLPADYKGSISAPNTTDDVFLRFDNNTRTYETEDIRRLLGATGEDLTIKDRGIFQLEPASNWTAMRTSNLYNISTGSFIAEVMGKFKTGFEDETAGDTLAFVPYSTPTDTIHRKHVHIVQQIFQTTSNPALALQAIDTIIMQMAYYDFLAQFDATAPGTWEPWVFVEIPTRFASFAAIIGLLVLHFALLLLALFLFFKKTDMSLLGNAWQAVSQVMSTDTADAVHHGAMATDTEMKKSVKKSRIAEGKILIAKSEQSGRTEATSVSRRR